MIDGDWSGGWSDEKKLFVRYIFKISFAVCLSVTILCGAITFFALLTMSFGSCTIMVPVVAGIIGIIFAGASATSYYLGEYLEKIIQRNEEKEKEERRYR